MFLKFDIDSCKDCYSCLRHCPVKAIDFTNNKAEIIENQCILCGECVHVCPQNAKKVYSDVDNVKKLIKENKLINDVELCGSFCLGRCAEGVSMLIDEEPIQNVNINNIDEIF